MTDQTSRLQSWLYPTYPSNPTYPPEHPVHSYDDHPAPSSSYSRQPYSPQEESKLRYLPLPTFPTSSTSASGVAQMDSGKEKQQKETEIDDQGEEEDYGGWDELAPGAAERAPRKRWYGDRGYRVEKADSSQRHSRGSEREMSTRSDSHEYQRNSSHQSRQTSFSSNIPIYSSATSRSPPCQHRTSQRNSYPIAFISSLPQSHFHPSSARPSSSRSPPPRNTSGGHTGTKSLSENRVSTFSHTEQRETTLRGAPDHIREAAERDPNRLEVRAPRVWGSGSGGGDHSGTTSHLHLSERRSSLPPFPLTQPVNEEGNDPGPSRTPTPRIAQEERGKEERSHRLWWFKPPHPVYSPTWASRRLLIRFPSPVPRRCIDDAMFSHFSKYGNIRLTQHIDAYGDSAEGCFVVFHEEEAVKACLDDPKHHELSYIPYPTLESRIIHIIATPGTQIDSSRTVFIKITGRRYDDPSPFSSSTTSHNIDDSTPLRLPKWIHIDGIPTIWGPQQRIRRIPTIRPAHLTRFDIEQRTRRETDQRVWDGPEFYLGRRVTEEEIIPRLCEVFAEIIEIVPPSTPGRGWLVTVASFGDAKGIMDQVGRIPGFLARLANDDDYATSSLSTPHGTASVCEDSGIVSLERSPRAPVVQEEVVKSSPLGSVPTSVVAQTHRPSAEVSDVIPYPVERSPHLVSQLSQNFPLPSQAIPNPPHIPLTSLPSPARLPNPTAPSLRTPHISPSFASPPSRPLPPNSSDPYYPSLHKRLVPTYKGRLLRESTDTVSGESRYYDECAVFVGKLVKGEETDKTLFQRFKLYGEICQIEYNPTATSSTYATARVLYRDRISVLRAIEAENGKVSFGSEIKVEERRVLASDVQLKEMYIDAQGRAVSPSMAPQYTPSPPLPTTHPAAGQNPPAHGQGPQLFSTPYWISVVPPQNMAMPGIHQQLPPIPIPHPPRPPSHAPLPQPGPHYPGGPAYPPHFMGYPSSMLAQPLYPMLYPMSMPIPSHPYSHPPSHIHPDLERYPPSISSLHLSPPISPATPFQPSSSAFPFVPAPPPPTAPLTPIPETSAPSSSAAILAAVAQSLSPLRAIGLREENGVMKVIYQDDELERYCLENGIAPPRRPGVRGGREDQRTHNPPNN